MPLVVMEEKQGLKIQFCFVFFSSPFTSSPSAELGWVWVLRTETSHPGQIWFLDLVAVFTSQADSIS